MLSIRFVPAANDEHGRARTMVEVDGVLDASSWANVHDDGVTVGLYMDEAVARIANVPTAELVPQIANVILPWSPDWEPMFASVELRTRWVSPSTEPELLFDLRIDVERWAQPWSIIEVADAVEAAVVELNIPGLRLRRDPEFVMNEFGFACDTEIDSRSINELVEVWAPRLREVMSLAHEKVQALVNREALVSQFAFPETTSVACQQYLLYFVQFLEDLSISAEATLESRAGRVLFTVRPRDGAEAMERVREALAVYLQLPARPDFEVEVSRHPDPSVRQLEANVHHLKGQLAIASAVVQAKDATIQALQAANTAVSRSLGATEAMNHSASADREPIAGGLVQVTRYTGKGFEVDLPTILRRLKRYAFGKE